MNINDVFNVILKYRKNKNYKINATIEKDKNEIKYANISLIKITKPETVEDKENKITITESQELNWEKEMLEDIKNIAKEK